MKTYDMGWIVNKYEERRQAREARMRQVIEQRVYGDAVPWADVLQQLQHGG